MSKKDELGPGTSFNRNVSARRSAINASTGAPTDGAPPPVELPVGDISLNPANPRSELGDLTELAASLKDHGQKAAISIMTRFSYLEANPGQEHDLETGTKYVAIDGNSRLSAAREAGLPTIKVMLDDDMGSDPESLLESALVANVHRKALEPLDEAHALKQLLTVHGTQTALAERLHRSQGWVSQRLALLGLTDELKGRLEKKQEAPELLRRVGSKKKEDQEKELARLKEEKARRKASQATTRATPMAPSSESPPVASQVPAASTDNSPPPPPVPTQQRAEPDSQSPPAAPEGERPSAPAPTLDAITWGDPAAVRELLMEWMEDEPRRLLVEMLAEEMAGRPSV
ncbi:ParB/RepB/Spo0J family partition protein [Streptomyces sp. 8L]|uniref:ParB/RepB/Spo0J family partition protein n=1 Tax=Streptomyces sp. 8L TaxID=2877242 RepID=UPI001CD59E45|nr:ParB/RepB/Spo0J family partition protein [Streptomyces sp. 8L]MCA1223966.1 ParB/RepB/Spo0J family partition protein [Streptomyces sp. 8L]